MRSSTVFVLASAALAVAGCASNPKPAPTPPAPVEAAVPPPKPAPVVTPPPAPPAPIGPAAGSKADFASKATDRVFFDYDKYNLDGTDMQALATQVAWLKKYPAAKVEIQGNADERGTREYNIALGARRATSVADYLKSQGIDGSRIQTVSFGKDKPFDPGHDEAAWAKNRNSYTNVISEQIG